MDSKKQVTVSLSLFLLLSSLLHISMAELPARPNKGVRLYLGSQKIVLPNYSTISQNQISTNQPSDGLWCQSANNGTNIGTWYQPNGRPIAEDSSFPLQPIVVQGQIGLTRTSPIEFPIEGLYRCVILNENGNTEELVVGIYTDTNYNNASVGPRTDNETLFNLISTRETDPPVFTLTFNVTNRPPTIVYCTLNNSALSIDSISRQVIQYTDPIVVMVTVTIATRERGQYMCSVGVDNSTMFGANTSTKFISVSYPVSNLQAIRINSSAIHLSWSPPPPSLPLGSLTEGGQGRGYEIYSKFTNMSTESITTVQVTTNTSIILTSNLIKNATSYEIFVVAFGGDLPSSAISVVTITTPEDKSRFEVCGGSFLECNSWKESTKLIVGSIFKSSLIQIMKDVCPDCDTNTHLTLTNDTIQCSNDNTVIYSVTLTNTNIDSVYTSDQILTLIRDSLSHGVTIHDGSNILTLRNNCSFPINEISSATPPIISAICTPSIITSITTITLTQTPTIIKTPTISNSGVMDNIRFMSIGGSVLFITVLILVILTVCILIIAKIKYDRLKAKLFKKLKSNISDGFEMIECDAYQSTDELRTIPPVNTIEPYSTLSSSTMSYHHQQQEHYTKLSLTTSTPNYDEYDSPYSTLSLINSGSTHSHTGIGGPCPSVIKDDNETKKDIPHVYEHVK